MKNKYKPNFYWHLGFLLVIAVEIWLMSRATFGSNIVATILGCFGGIVLLGLGRANNLARFMDSGGRYVEWPILKADSVLNLLYATGWTVGMINFGFVALELSR